MGHYLPLSVGCRNCILSKTTAPVSWHGASRRVPRVVRVTIGVLRWLVFSSKNRTMHPYGGMDNLRGLDRTRPSP